MQKSTKLMVALAFAGLAVAGSGTALTGTGLARSAGATQFIGGTVSQTVTGATLSNVAYGFSDAGAKTSVNSITLTFTTTADGLAVSATPSGGSGGTFTCTVVASNSSTCSFVQDPATTTVTETGYTGLSSLDVTVAA